MATPTDTATLATVHCHTLSATDWQTPARLPGTAAPLRVFRAFVPAFVPDLPDWLALLAPAERERARRYHRPADQQRFVVGRGLLRVLLGHATAQHPAGLRFETYGNGKPRLAGPDAPSFNVSHAGDWVVIALAEAPVGIDVERIDPAFPFGDLLAHTFSLEERAQLAHSRHSRREFYTLWTRKEALSKATAHGLSDYLDQLPVRDGTQSLPADRLGHGGTWFVSSFSVAESYPAALAFGEPVLPRFYTATTDWRP